MINLIRSTLRWKLLTIFLALIFFIIAAIGIFSFLETTRTIKSDVERFSNQILKQANLNFSRYYRDNEQFFITIAGSEEFYDWLGITIGNEYMSYRLYKDIENRFIEPYVKYHPEVLSVKFYNANGIEKIYRTGSKVYNLILNTDYSLAAEEWLANNSLSGNITRIVSHSQNYKDSIGRPVVTPVMTFVKRINFFDEYEGFLAIDISLIPTQEILQQIELGNQGESLIVDETGTILAHPDTSQINTLLDPTIYESTKGQESGWFLTDDSKQMVVYQTVPETSWQIMVLIPYRDVASSIYTVRNITITIAVIGMIIAAILVYWVSGSITRRIKALQSTIKLTETGKLEQRVEVRGNDEIAYLAKSYNHLLDRIDSTIRDLTESRIMQQEAVLSALQSQINSHFLYNALESINAMANLADHRDIQRTAVALSSMLRYTSNYKETQVTIEHEIKHLKDYLYIMNILYGDDIRYEISLPEPLKCVRCLKAIIQPLVENSIKHGYEVTGDSLLISISVETWKEDDVRIIIADNGKGFDAEKFAEVQRALAENDSKQPANALSGVGLINVNQRMRMYYPYDDAGIKLEKQPKGTRIIITIHPKGGYVA